MEAITDFGDSALLLPAALLLIVYLWITGHSRLAMRWCFTLGLCLFLTLVLKLGFHACGGEAPELDIRSPSGHTALSTTVYGSLAVLLASGRALRWALPIALAAASLIAGIAASRVLLHAHTLTEVIAGLAIGGICVCSFRFWNLELPEEALPFRRLAVALILLGAVFHGRHLNAEELISRLARDFSQSADICTEAKTGTFIRS